MIDAGVVRSMLTSLVRLVDSPAASVALAVLLPFFSETESETEAPAAPMDVGSAAAAICALMLSAGAWVACSPGSDISPYFSPGATIDLVRDPVIGDHTHARVIPEISEQILRGSS